MTQETLTIHDGIDYWNLKLMFSKCSSLKKIVLRGDSKRYSIKDNLFILSKDQKTLLLACKIGRAHV